MARYTPKPTPSPAATTSTDNNGPQKRPYLIRHSRHIKSQLLSDIRILDNHVPDSYLQIANKQIPSSPDEVMCKMHCGLIVAPESKLRCLSDGLSIDAFALMGYCTEEDACAV